MNRPEPAASAIEPGLDQSVAADAVEQQRAQNLFLAWSDGRRLAENCRFPAGAVAADRDRGLWLLRSARIRQQRWLRLAVEQAAVTDPLVEAAIPYEVAKRSIDIIVASLLLILFAPLTLPLGLLIWLDSSGPVFFRQRRVGRDGEEFALWKFRSMYAGSAAYALSPTHEDDPRITRIGRVLRRTSLDEFPQLINVLRGEMSLVGPRPEMPFIVERYTSRERQRLEVRPGITGLWQISPARAQPIHENLEYDFHYIRHRSLALDGVILLRTIAAVVRGVGAV